MKKKKIGKGMLVKNKIDSSLKRVIFYMFKTKVWSPIDIGLLKWASILFGMILGAYLNAFVKQHLWVFILLTVVFTVRPLYSYWIKK